MRIREGTPANGKLTNRLRRIAVQITGQLPEGRKDALYVLDYARHLLGVLDEPDDLVR
jgi:hypothetical protein